MASAITMTAEERKFVNEHPVIVALKEVALSALEKAVDKLPPLFALGAKDNNCILAPAKELDWEMVKRAVSLFTNGQSQALPKEPEDVMIISTMSPFPQPAWIKSPDYWKIVFENLRPEFDIPRFIQDYISPDFLDRLIKPEDQAKIHKAIQDGFGDLEELASRLRDKLFPHLSGLWKSMPAVERSRDEFLRIIGYGLTSTVFYYVTLAATGARLPMESISSFIELWRRPAASSPGASMLCVPVGIKENKWMLLGS